MKPLKGMQAFIPVSPILLIPSVLRKEQILIQGGLRDRKQGVVATVSALALKHVIHNTPPSPCRILKTLALEIL